MKYALALALALAATPAFAWDIGRLAPLAGLEHPYYPPQPYQPRPRYQPQFQHVIPDGFGGYNVIGPGRSLTFVVPDGFGGYTILGD